MAVARCCSDDNATSGFVDARIYPQWPYDAELVGHTLSDSPGGRTGGEL